MDKGKRPAFECEHHRQTRMRKKNEEEANQKKAFVERIFGYKLQRMKDREDKKGKDWVPTSLESCDYFLMDWGKLDKIYEKEKQLGKLVRDRLMSKEDRDVEVKRMYAQYDREEEEKRVVQEEEIAKYVEEHEARERS